MTASTLMNKSKKELAELVLSKEKTIATLKDDLQSADVEFTEYRETKEDSISNANKQIETLTNKFNKLDKEFNHKVEELVDVKLKYKKTLEVIENQEHIIKNQVSDINRKTTELNDLQKIIEKHQKENEELHEELNSTRDEIDDLTTDLFIGHKTNKVLVFTNVFTGIAFVILLIYMLFY